MNKVKTGPFISYFLREYQQNQRNLEDTFKIVAEYGFDFVTLNLSYPIMEKYTAKQIKKLIEDFNLELACHGPYSLLIASLYEDTRQAMVKISQSCIEFSDILDARYLNLHFFEAPYYYIPFDEAKQIIAKQSWKSVKEICNFAEKIETSVTITFETPPDKISEDVSLVAAALEPDNAYFLLDVGHAMRSSQDPLVYLRDERIKTKTVACHLHDVKNNVDHHPIGDGILNWSLIRRSLKALPNLQYAIFECGDYDSNGNLTIANLAKIKQIQNSWLKIW